MGAHEAHHLLTDYATQQSEDERSARIREIARLITENSKELLERLA